MPDLLSIDELQKVYIELLDEFVIICKDNHLRYDLCGGSMLGAVRHQGFIPWDNDIDVCMPRPDYEKLLDLYAEKKLIVPKHRDFIMFQNYTFERHYSRYIRYDVKRYSEFLEDGDCPYIGIDIFTVDGLPEKQWQLNLHMRRIQLLRRLLLISVSKPNESSRGAFVSLLKDLTRPVLRLYGSHNIVKKLDKICKKYSYTDSEYVGIANGMYGAKERWSKKDMLPQERFRFAHNYYLGFKNYDIYLTNLYGKYMQLPPENERVPHCDDGYRVKPTEGE